MIKMLNLDLNNFLSHVSTHLSINDYDGLVLIEGKTNDGHYNSNGSGKSTILEGIVYALTGDTLRGVSVNDVVNRNYKKNTKVSLDLLKEGTHYTVTRYRKDDTLGDSLVLMKEGEDISKRVNKETQKSLDDILGISYKILVSTVLLGEGLSSKFTQLSDPEKKSLIESTLNLNYDISTIRSKANTKLSQLKLDVSNLEGRLSTLKELSSLDVEETKNKIALLEAETSKAVLEVDSLQGVLASLTGNREIIMKKINVLRDSLNDSDNLSIELNRLNAELGKYIQELQVVETAESPKCTVCHQSLVSEESKLSFKVSYDEKISNITSLIDSCKERLSSLPDKDLLNSKYEFLSKEIGDIDKQIADYNLSINTATSNRWSLQSQVDQLKDEVRRYEENTSDISLLEKDIDSKNAEISMYDYFYKLFSPTGIIVNILSDAIEYINDRLSTYSEVLLEKDYKINFVKGKISLVDSQGSNYQSLSNGEKRRLDIAIQFSLHDYIHMYCGMKLDCCFIDEILDTLDDTGVENIFEILRLKLEYCQLKSIYVITHNNSLKDKFDKVITISKDEKGDSYLL